MIKIKKLLTSLGAISLVASASSLVVSCTSVSDVENRSIDTGVYKTVYTNSIQNWNLAATMQSADIKLVSNTQDSLMTYAMGDDKKNNPEPTAQIAKVDSQDDQNGTITLSINGDPYWYESSTGKKVEPITVKDIQNTAKYTLDPKNASELIGDWKTLVKGANQYNKDLQNAEDQFSKDGNQQELDKAKDDAWNKFEPNIHIEGDKITFNILESPEVFESALTTGSFSPTPDRALSIGYDYGRSGYDNVLLTGPYYIAKYTPSTLIELKRNKNYEDDNKGTINTIDYFFSSSSDEATQRRLWEIGDVTESMISPNDTYAVKKYADAFKNVKKIPNNLVGSKSLWFNFTKQDKDGNPDVQSNEALSLDSVRTLITYGMDRKRLARYFAGPNGDVNDYLTNSFNPSGYLKDKNGDYVSGDLNKAWDGKSLSKGGDAYYENPSLITKSDQLQNVQPTMDGLIQKVKSDLSSKGLSKVKLSFLTSGVNATTFNPFIMQMINAFNDIPDNPVQIVQQQSNGDSDYQSAQVEGNFSMFITGETPTFIDPISFLNNLKINGNMSLYMGLSRLFDSNGDIAKYYKTDSKGNIVKDSNGKPIQTGDALTKYGVNKTFTNEMTKFTKLLNDTDNDKSIKTNKDKRYEGFAAAEAAALYNYKIVMPLYIPNGKENNYLTYVDEKTRPNVGYGYNDYRLDKVKLVKTFKDYLNDNQMKTDVNKQYVISDKRD